MKKIKWSIMSLAVIFSIAAAFTTKPHFDCTTWPQYYYTGSQYLPVALNYTCAQGIYTCTYYSTNGGLTYSPCVAGVYTPFAGYTVENPSTAKPAVNPGHSAVSPH